MVVKSIDNLIIARKILWLMTFMLVMIPLSLAQPYDLGTLPSIVSDVEWPVAPTITSNTVVTNSAEFQTALSTDGVSATIRPETYSFNAVVSCSDCEFNFDSGAELHGSLQFTGNRIRWVNSTVIGGPVRQEGTGDVLIQNMYARTDGETNSFSGPPTPFERVAIVDSTLVLENGNPASQWAIYVQGPSGSNQYRGRNLLLANVRLESDAQNNRFNAIENLVIVDSYFNGNVESVNGLRMHLGNQDVYVRDTVIVGPPVGGCCGPSPPDQVIDGIFEGIERYAPNNAGWYAGIGALCSDVELLDSQYYSGQNPGVAYPLGCMTDGGGNNPTSLAWDRITVPDASSVGADHGPLAPAACSDGQTRSCGTNVGECSAGTETCSSGQWGTCSGSTSPTTEICDELDNDCDGQIDEGLSCVQEAASINVLISPTNGSLYTSRFPQLRLNRTVLQQQNYSFPCWYTINNGERRSCFERHHIGVRGENNLRVYLHDSFGHLAIHNVTFTTTAPIQILFNRTYFNLSRTTNFSRFAQNQLADVRNSEVVTNHGKIAFNQLQLHRSITVNREIEISQNKIFVNSSLFSEFNQSAVLTLSNIDFANPRILKDGQPCPGSLCTINNYSNGELIFTVEHFSTYESEETPPSCSDGIQNGDETGVDCGGSCGACSSPSSSSSGGSGGGGGGGGGGSRYNAATTPSQEKPTVSSMLIIVSPLPNGEYEGAIPSIEKGQLVHFNLEELPEQFVIHNLRDEKKFLSTSEGADDDGTAHYTLELHEPSLSITESSEQLVETATEAVQQTIEDINDLRQEDPKRFNYFSMILFIIVFIAIMTMATIFIFHNIHGHRKVYQKYPKWVVLRETSNIQKLIRQYPQYSQQQLTQVFLKKGWDKDIIVEAFRREGLHKQT